MCDFVQYKLFLYVKMRKLLISYNLWFLRVFCQKNSEKIIGKSFGI